MTLENLRDHCRGVIQQYPHLKESVTDLFVLCINEIEEGGSESHEVELCYNDLEELLKEESE